ncbi:adenylosuccinate lyase, partial [Lactobacillus sp. XV13L]|nr:adenylosuccinate lyase [Lactobacillus sp. XV13L]
LAMEKITKHDVVAFTRTVSQSLGPEKKWIHYGVTSTDIVDTAYGYLLKQANVILRQDLQALADTVAQKARQYKNTVMIGRTHGVHAEPTTFGLVLANWYSEIKRDQERFEHAARGVEAGKISGAVGTFANISPQAEAIVCEILGIHPQEISTQVLPRDLHAEYIMTLALIAAAIERFALEIRHLQRTE